MRPSPQGLLFACGFVVAIGLFADAAEAMPADPFFRARTALEELQTAWIPGDAQRAAAHLALAERHFSEMQQAVDAGRPTAALRAAEALAAQVSAADQSLTAAASTGWTSQLDGLEEELHRFLDRLSAFAPDG